MKEVRNIVYFVYIVLFKASHVSCFGESCQDIDHVACVDMKRQNANLCSNPVLRNSACPRLCNSCPITCYNCNITTPDVSSCNTMTCGSDQVCMIKKIRPMTGEMYSYTLACENTAVCNGNRKRSMTSRSVHIDCCQTDLCNHPHITTTTTPTTTIQTSTIPSTTKSTTFNSITTAALLSAGSQNYGQWSAWSSWGGCILTTSKGIGYKNRTRVCTPSSSDSCSGETVEVDQCSEACTPAQIINIEVMGKWEMQGTVLLHCVTKGNPKPIVKWITHTAKSDLNVQSFDGDGSRILIGPVTQRPAGWYICQASNYCGVVATKNYFAPSFISE